MVNNGRVLLQQPLGVRGKNAFFTLKLDQLFVHQLDVALGEIIRIGWSKLGTPSICDTSSIYLRMWIRQIDKFRLENVFFTQKKNLEIKN